MTARRLILAVLLVVLGAAAAWLWFGGEEIQGTSPAHHGDHEHSARRAPAPKSAPGESTSVKSSVTPGAPLVRTGSNPPGANEAALPTVEPSLTSSAQPQREGTTELEAVRFMIRDFRTRMGENPVGSNAEIMRAVMGGNSVGATLGPPEGQSLNTEGELVDRWGTPYFFHQLSKTNMEIHSAGPDRQMGTADDLITK